jgi:hypothetical protein
VARRQWVRLPSAWIANGGLEKLSWTYGGAGSDNIAALMLLTAIAHAADQDSGIARLTYEDICAVTGLSRAKVSNGLEVLRKIEIVDRGPDAARSTYRLMNYDPQGNWAKFPRGACMLAEDRAVQRCSARTHQDCSQSVGIALAGLCRACPERSLRAGNCKCIPDRRRGFLQPHGDPRTRHERGRPRTT